MTTFLIGGQIKKTLPFQHFNGKTNFELDLSNYEAKADLKKAAGVDTSNLVAKSDLISLKSEVDETNTNKLKNCFFCLK